MHLRTLVLIGGTLVALLPATGIAHEGHGHVEHPSGLAHYLLSPSHFVPWLALAVTVLLALAAVRNRIRAVRSCRPEQRKP